MSKINKWLNDSLFTSPISRGCTMCAEGAKLVLLITGLCLAKCFYCPLSTKKQGMDRIFADEWELDDEDDFEKIIKEAEFIDAKGAGITGGDPLFVWKRTERYIFLLKEKFGDDFHVHLYTSALNNSNHIKDLINAGLDEIRFHPSPNNWSEMEKSPIIRAIKIALDEDVDVAIEIPCIPNADEDIYSLIRWADNNGVKWINLNELEFSETNSESFYKMGYVVKNDISAAVEGSQDTAYRILDSISILDLNAGIHYCSCSFKDGIQLRNRIKRRANNVAKKFEIITDDGTILKGIIPVDKKGFKQLIFYLKNVYDISQDLLFYNEEKRQIETAVSILERIAPDLIRKKILCYIVEEYPTSDSLEVSRFPLPL